MVEWIMYLINCLVNTSYLPMLLHSASGVARISCREEARN